MCFQQYFTKHPQNKYNIIAHQIENGYTICYNLMIVYSSATDKPPFLWSCIWNAVKLKSLLQVKERCSLAQLVLKCKPLEIENRLVTSWNRRKGEQQNVCMLS